MKKLSVFLFFLWSASVVFNASRPSKLPELGIENIDKLIHFLYYIPGGFFCFLYLERYEVRSKKLSFLLCIIISLIDEFIQSFIPGRNSDIFDILADSLGIALGIILGSMRIKSEKTKEKI
jgi:VanZ family protein